jgi:ATP synthase F0 subunit b
MNGNQFYLQAALWSQVIASILFMGVLVWLWVRYFQPAILVAQERYNRQIAEAERHRDEAKAMLDLLRSEIEGASRDAALIRERASAQAAREYEASVEEARESGERSLQNARGELARARAAATHRLRDEILSQALEQARTIASDRIDPATNSRLVDRFVASLGSR